jgi:hypothetical protein
VLLKERAGREAAEAALKSAREAIENYLNGNYNSPRAFRSSTGKCKHDTFYWRPCEACIDAHFEAALVAMEPKNEPQGTDQG